MEENGSEIERLKKGQMESVQTKLKLEEQVRSLARQIARLESEAKLNVDDEKELLSRLLSVQKELDLVREDAEQKETKSQKHIRRLQLELENLRDHTEKLSRDLLYCTLDGKRCQLSITTFTSAITRISGSIKTTQE